MKGSKDKRWDLGTWTRYEVTGDVQEKYGWEGTEGKVREGKLEGNRKANRRKPWERSTDERGE